LNPAGYVARGAGIDTRPVKAENAAERISELAGQYGYDAATIATLLGGYAPEYVSGTGLGGNVTRAMAAGGVPLALRASTGSATLTGGLDVQNPYLRNLTDLAGGMAGSMTTAIDDAARSGWNGIKRAFVPNSAAEAKSFRPSLSKAEVKQMKTLQRNIDNESLNNAIDEATRTGRSVVEVGDDSILQAAQKARQQSPQARKIIENDLRKIIDAQAGKTRGVIDEQLGTRGKASTVAGVEEAAQRKAQPLYQEIENMGNLGANKQLANVVKKNDVVADAVKGVKRANSSLKKLPNTDARVLLEARKALSKASTNQTELSGHEARMALKEFDPVFNEVTGGKVAEANKIYSEAYRFQEAADLGRDVFNNRQSVEEFTRNVKNLTAGEKRALTIGLRDELVNRLGSVENEAIGSKKFLVQNVRDKIKVAVGEKKAKAIINEAEDAVRMNRNANKITGGSPTASNQTLRDMVGKVKNVILHPYKTAVDVAFKPFDPNNVVLAEGLTNPNLARNYRRWQTALALEDKQTPVRNAVEQTLLRNYIYNNQ